MNNRFTKNKKSKQKLSSILKNISFIHSNTKICLVGFIVILLTLIFHPIVLAGGLNASEITIPILTYHKFCQGPSPDPYTINIKRFRKQMLYLQEQNYEVISVSDLLKCIHKNNFPAKPVIITIDDGYKSVYRLAYPVLKEFRYPATLYLYTNFINNGPEQLSWEEIIEMISDDIEIGSHTVSHCNLLHKYSHESYMEYLKRINDELCQSKAILEKNTGVEIQSFAYPYGVYSQQIKTLANYAGYQALLNVNFMNNSTPPDPYALNRQIIPAECTVSQFDALLNEKALKVHQIFPADGTITHNQSIKIGAILNDQQIDADSLELSISGSGGLDYCFKKEKQEISFKPTAPKLLRKKTWVVRIAARDKESGYQRKISWLFTVQ